MAVPGTLCSALTACPEKGERMAPGVPRNRAVRHDLGLGLSGHESHICPVQQAHLHCTNPGSCEIPAAARKGTVSSAAGDCLISL